MEWSATFQVQRDARCDSSWKLYAGAHTGEREEERKEKHTLRKEEEKAHSEHGVVSP
jgi:hypothetical protein